MTCADWLEWSLCGTHTITGTRARICAEDIVVGTDTALLNIYCQCSTCSRMIRRLALYLIIYGSSYRLSQWYSRVSKYLIPWILYVVFFLEYSKATCLFVGFSVVERQGANQQGQHKQRRPTTAKARVLGVLSMPDKMKDFMYSNTESCFSHLRSPSYCDLRGASHVWGELSHKQ
jgi:hypothetical protein